MQEATLIERNGVVTNSVLHGSLFTRRSTAMEARVYKIESIAYTEESFVDISASYVPLKADGRMEILDWDNSEFVIEDLRS